MPDSYDLGNCSRIMEENSDQLESQSRYRSLQETIHPSSNESSMEKPQSHFNMTNSTDERAAPREYEGSTSNCMQSSMHVEQGPCLSDLVGEDSLNISDSAVLLETGGQRKCTPKGENDAQNASAKVNEVNYTRNTKNEDAVSLGSSRAETIPTSSARYALEPNLDMMGTMDMMMETAIRMINPIAQYASVPDLDTKEKIKTEEKLVVKVEAMNLAEEEPSKHGDEAKLEDKMEPEKVPKNLRRKWRRQRRRLRALGLLESVPQQGWEEYHCKDCNVSCTGPAPWMDHQSTKKHRIAIRTAELNETANAFIAEKCKLACKLIKEGLI